MMNQNDQKRIRSLNQKKYRDKYRQFQIEGVRLVESAVLAQTKIVKLYWTESVENQYPNFVTTVINNGIGITRVTDKEIQSISYTKSPSGVVGICEIPDSSDLDVTSNTHWIYLDRISDPGNLGTILRTAAWFDIRHIALSAGCVDPYNPKTVRSGMGAHFDLNIHPNVQIELFKKAGYTLIGADISGDDVAISNVQKPWVLILGGEANGIQQDTLSQCDTILSIPKLGTGDSLNVASASAILLYELSKL